MLCNNMVAVVSNRNIHQEFFICCSTCLVYAGPVTFSLYIIIQVMLCTKVLSGSTAGLSHSVSLNKICGIVIKLALILLSIVL